MVCGKCGHENGQQDKFCGNCGTALTNIEPSGKPKKKTAAILLSFLALGGIGLGAAWFMPEEKTPSSSLAEGEIEEPEQLVETEELVEGAVVQAEDIIPPSEQPEKVEPKKIGKTEVIKESQQKTYTILTEGGQGSGFLFTDQGMVATNAHVVAGYTDVIVRNINGQDVPGQVIGISDESDIALIKVEAFEGIIPLESEMGPTDIGTEIIALGSPSGFENTATIGYLTGIDRDFEQEFLYEDIYQIDAPIAQGSSGGPLLDASTGKVIGINSLVMTEGDSLGFSIPLYSMHAELTQWAENPMIPEEVTEKFHVYDDFSSYEDEEYEYDYDLEMEFSETNLQQFIGDFRYYYELALQNEDFFYVQNVLVYESDIYNSILEYINEIAGQGMEFNFRKLEITDIEIKDDAAVVQTEESFDFKNAAGELSVEERRKSYTIVMDENGFYYVSDIINHE
ncbi:MAG TPA: trypsin-like peptidase domain-containing protein [Planococcus sp. (in: firmicutes)]|nr:trypsin-like peptidase domain-containing protein [Planococcus sp. (in: firmicutes)]